MGSFNGIGLRFLGFSKLDENNACYATVWFTLFFVPLIPLYRAKIKRMATNSVDFVFTMLAKERLVPMEIVKVLVEGWIVIPTCILLPLIVCIPAVGIVGLPDTVGNVLFRVQAMSTFNTIFFAAIGWLLVSMFFFIDRDYKKGLPANWREVSNENNMIKHKLSSSSLNNEFFGKLQKGDLKGAADIVEKTCEVNRDAAKRYAEYMSAVLY